MSEIERYEFTTDTGYLCVVEKSNAARNPAHYIDSESDGPNAWQIAVEILRLAAQVSAQAAEIERLRGTVDRLFEKCRITLYHDDGSYPFEHMAVAGKDSREKILAALEPKP